MCAATVAALLSCCVRFLDADQSPAKLPIGLDWTHWTKEECNAMRTKSPWGSTSRFWSKHKGTEYVWGQLPVASRNAELCSALPVREAVLREDQLKKHYDTMSAQQKLAVDKKNPPDITEHENDPILLYIENDGESGEGYVGDSPYHPSGVEMTHCGPHPATQVALKLADGSLVMPIKTEALQNDRDNNRTMYSFPRVINGKPVLSVSDQYLTFVLGEVLNGGRRIRPLQDPKKFRVASDWMDPYEISFRVTGLIYNGKLEY